MKSISIKSDGTVAGTSVLVDGERVSNVTAVEWSIGPTEKGSYTSRAKLTIANVELESLTEGEEVKDDFREGETCGFCNRPLTEPAGEGCVGTYHAAPPTETEVEVEQRQDFEVTE